MLKKFTLTVFAIFWSCALPAQNIMGTWYGLLNVQGFELTIVFHIASKGDGYTATMDSPDQGAKGIPVTEVTFKDSQLQLKVAPAKITYNATLKNTILVGTFEQNGMTLPLDLSREQPQKKQKLRPQEPKAPFPYHIEDVKFENKKDKIVLAGTLTLPAKTGKYPVVILISGSGPQNRDEEILGHKPFWILADYLTRLGIGVLRFDDRGTNASTGDFNAATSEDFAKDVFAAIQYLKTRKDIQPKKIGLIGHSEGGLIAPMIASKSKDVAFIVLLAGTGRQGSDIIKLQQRLIARAAGASEESIEKEQKWNDIYMDIVLKAKTVQEAKENLTNYLKANIKEIFPNQDEASQSAFIKQLLAGWATPWMKFFLSYDPKGALEKVTCPVLALNGSKDLQVTAKENLASIQEALQKGGNKKFVVKELPNLNHLFQECNTGAPTEYGEITQTFAPSALREIAEWLAQQIR